MAHSCHAIGCSKHVPPAMFMCKPHWFGLPKKLRDRIWDTYRPGQCDDWNISKEYASAAQECLRHVAQKEGRPVTGDEPELTLYDALSDTEGSDA